MDEIPLQDYYDYAEFEIIKVGTGQATRAVYLYPNPKVGKIYRNPLVCPKSDQNVTITEIIGLDKQKNPDFEYGPPIIKCIHIQQQKVRVVRDLKNGN